MRVTAFSCLSLGTLAISGLLAGICLEPVSLAQEHPEKETGTNANCPAIGTTTGTKELGHSCQLSAPAAFPEPNHATKRNSSLEMSDSGLVFAAGRTIQDARKYFEKSARRGNAAAQVNLAMLYVHGWGVPQNYGAALYWLESAADQGIPALTPISGFCI